MDFLVVIKTILSQVCKMVPDGILLPSFLMLPLFCLNTVLTSQNLDVFPQNWIYICSVFDSTFHLQFGDTWPTTEHEAYISPASIKHTSILLEISFENLAYNCQYIAVAERWMSISLLLAHSSANFSLWWAIVRHHKV